jgi:hypothetical protein
MPQMPIHYYDCLACGTCWKLGTKVLPDPIRQILKSPGLKNSPGKPGPSAS